MGKMPQNPHQIWDTNSRPMNFGPTRQGETVRKCVDCGAEYKPKARNQKYCPECGAKRKKGL